MVRRNRTRGMRPDGALDGADGAQFITTSDKTTINSCWTTAASYWFANGSMEMEELNPYCVGRGWNLRPCISYADL